jgi:predicted outer membrane repeat protein
MLLLCRAIALGQQVDTDGDGLSDFQEIHKYLTNPDKADSDDDGTPDGEWDERREYAYTVCSILRFMRPFDEDALNDNFQDARILKEEAYYTELEVIYYPFSTAENTISANADWQQDYAAMTEYLQPGITTNWDIGMKQNLLAELQADGIVVDNLTDKQVVEQVSSWVLNNYTAFADIFTTYYVYYPNSEPTIYPGLEAAFERDKGPYGWTVEEQFEHELLGKGMYCNKTRGTCTSTAVALTTALRAIGIPARMIIVIPIVDASNPNQARLVEQGITNGHVRRVILDWLNGAGTGFTAHTFNEVYVGNRWHRLNYSKLGQPILDEHCFGLHTRLYTFNDLSAADLAPTWGWRYGKSITNDVFGYYNPYTTMTLSDSNTGTIGPIIYVDDDAPGDPGPGNSVISDPCEDGSSLHPFDSIQEAIDAGDYLDTVIVRQGIYTGIGNRDIDFRGLAIAVRSTDPNNPDVVAATVIDCQGSELEPHRGFYFHSGEGSGSILNGLTITNGCVSGTWPNDSGGGIICYYNTSPIIKNCIVTSNTAEHHGGGIYSYISSPTLINCMFNANSAGWNGGGMHNGPSSPNLINCIFAENTSGSYGGGISTSSDSSLILTNCTFSGNSGSNGGAIGVRNSNTQITNCVLWGDIPNEIYVAAGDIPNITYSNIQGGFSGTGNIYADPCFADANNGDYHLKSEAGRWDANSQTWIKDDVNSPCIDAGDPNSDWRRELWPHGKRINMGAYGGTPEASMSLSDAGNIADLNFDGLLCYRDMKLLIDKWLCETALQAEDLSRDGFVNFTDFAIFALDFELPARNPNPADGATGVNITADLSWMAGSYATSHDVYFGTSDPPPFIGNQSSTTFDPGTMDYSTTYFWRIDEINQWGTTAGPVWSFTTIMTPPPPPLP